LIPKGTTLTMSGAANKSLQQRTLNIAGGLIWSGTGNLNTGVGAMINVQSGGTFDMQNDQSLTQNLGGTTFQLNVQMGGTLTKSAGTGTTTLSGIVSTFAGTTTVMSGTLALTGTSTTTGAFNISSGAELDFSGGTHTLNAGTAVSGTGLVRLIAGTLTVAAAVSIPNLEISGGTLDGVGTLTVGNTLNWLSGTISGGGILLI